MNERGFFIMKHSNRKQKGISTIVIVVLLALIFIFLIVDIVLYSILTKSTKHTTDTTSSKTSTTTTEQTASSTSESVTEESITLPDYKSAYYSIINDKKADISNYDWQYGFEYNEWGDNSVQESTPIALTDINEDNIPELLVAYCTNDYDSKVNACMDIYTVDANGTARLLYSNESWDVLAAGGTGYYVFTIADNPHLFAYTSMADEIESSCIWEFVPKEDGTLETKEILSYTEEISDDFSGYKPLYYKDGADCTKDEYNSALNNMFNNMSHFLMYNVCGRTEDTISSILSHNTLEALTYGQAYRELGLIEPTEENPLPFANDLSFAFSSGAGGWSTDIVLHPDGTFSGTYHDNDMSGGDGYDATMYICEFDGKFNNIKKADNDSYTMTLEYCNVKDTPDSTWIEDRIQYIASDPYGIDGGKNFTLYLPGTFVQSLPEMYVGWVYNLEKNTTLSGFGLYNTETQDGFYAY